VGLNIPLVDVEVSVEVGSQARCGRRMRACRLQVEVVSLGRSRRLVVHAHVPEVEAAEVVWLAGAVVDGTVDRHVASAAPSRVRMRPHGGEWR
jgi:hypothetical protein